MTMTPTGYFVWRRTALGKVTSEKILNEHRQFMLSGSSADKDRWHARLIKDHPLNQKEYQWPLEMLEAKYPCPEQTIRSRWWRDPNAERGHAREPTP